MATFQKLKFLIIIISGYETTTKNKVKYIIVILQNI